MELLEIAREDLTLRPYQTKSKEDIYKAWESVPSVMFQMPTGTGKTRLFASIIKDIQTLSVRKKERMGVLVLVHRSELIEQIHETLSFKYGIAHGIIKAGFDEDKRMPVQVASVQSLTRRLDTWKEKSFSYIVIDEAHHGDGIKAQMRAHQQRLGITGADAADTGAAMELLQISGELGAERGALHIVDLALITVFLIVDHHTAAAGTQMGMVVYAEIHVSNDVAVRYRSEEAAH